MRNQWNQENKQHFLMKIWRQFSIGSGQDSIQVHGKVTEESNFLYFQLLTTQKLQASRCSCLRSQFRSQFRITIARDIRRVRLSRSLSAKIGDTQHTTLSDNEERNCIVEKSRLRPEHVKRMTFSLLPIIDCLYTSLGKYRTFTRVLSGNHRQPIGKRVKSGLLTGFTYTIELCFEFSVFSTIKRDKETFENSDLSPLSSRVRTQIIWVPRSPPRRGCDIEQPRQSWLNAQSDIYIVDNALIIDRERYICINRYAIGLAIRKLYIIINQFNRVKIRHIKVCHVRVIFYYPD